MTCRFFEDILSDIVRRILLTYSFVSALLSVLPCRSDPFSSKISLPSASRLHERGLTVVNPNPQYSYFPKAIKTKIPAAVFIHKHTPWRISYHATHILFWTPQTRAKSFNRISSPFTIKLLCDEIFSHSHNNFHLVGVIIINCIQPKLQIVMYLFFHRSAKMKAFRIKRV